MDATPLGIAPTRMIPAATSPSKPNSLVSVYPVVGMMTKCRATPMMIERGKARTRTKSATLNFVPIPNMMI